MSAPPGPYSTISRTRRPSSAPLSAKRKRSACQPSPEQCRRQEQGRQDTRLRGVSPARRSSSDGGLRRGQGCCHGEQATTERSASAQCSGRSTGPTERRVAAAEAARAPAFASAPAYRGSGGGRGRRAPVRKATSSTSAATVTVRRYRRSTYRRNLRRRSSHVAPGQPVEVRVTCSEAVLQVGWRDFGGQGATFAPLPPDNATGISQVVQRIPIRSNSHRVSRWSSGCGRVCPW